jgi:hypothetical protein
LAVCAFLGVGFEEQMLRYELMGFGLNHLRTTRTSESLCWPTAVSPGETIRSVPNSRPG